MASLDKASVREEVGRLNADFDRLGAEGKVSAEIQAIMNSLFMIIELILAIFLERTTKKNDKNASIPSSQTEKDESALGHSGSNGKGKSENKGQTRNSYVNETVTISQVSTCDVCAEDLSGVPCVGHERRTKIDIIFEKVVDHVDDEIKRCPSCDATVKGLFPSDQHGPLQYGDGLKAFVINLLVSQMVALNRVQKLVKSMIGVVIAEASLLKFVLRLHQALATWEQQATEQILNTPAINVDDRPSGLIQKTTGFMCMLQVTLPSSFYTASGAKLPSMKSTSFRAMIEKPTRKSSDRHTNKRIEGYTV